MGPVVDHRLGVAAFALGDFVFVVGEQKIEPAAVDVECLAQELAAHRRAFDVPARAALAPGAVPRRLLRLGRLPEGEVRDVPLAGGRLAAVAVDRLDAAVRELAVLQVLADVEVHVAVRRVREAALN